MIEEHDDVVAGAIAAHCPWGVAGTSAIGFSIARHAFS
jgi:hypothetical protein